METVSLNAYFLQIVLSYLAKDPQIQLLAELLEYILNMLRELYMVVL